MPRRLPAARECGWSCADAHAARFYVPESLDYDFLARVTETVLRALRIVAL